MDSFHAHRIVAQHPLPIVHYDVYPILFKVAFQDRRHQALQDLVATWPFPKLHVLQLLGCKELVLDHDYKPCIDAIIRGVVKQLQRGLEEPGSDSSRCQLRVLDMTGVRDVKYRLYFSLTKALSEACLEVSKHQQELQRHGSKRHKGCSGSATAAPQFQGVDIRVYLRVNSSSFKILRDALQTGAAGPLRLKCYDFKAENLSASQIVTLLESLDPSCLQRVHLSSISFGSLSEIIPHLLRFPELCSLMIPFYKFHVPLVTPKRPMKIPCEAAQLGKLLGLRELNLRMIKVSGNLHQILCYLQAPLESLNLHHCSLVPDDLTFLSQSVHAPAFKKLNLSSNDISKGLLEPLQLLLEKASASLLYLDLSYCHIADSHLAVLLPTLLCCSRLRFLRLDGNSLSTAALKDLLQKTVELPNLHKILYPIPEDCGRLEPSDFRRNFVTDEERLAVAKAEFSQILANSGRTDLIWTHDRNDHKAMDYFSL